MRWLRKELERCLMDRAFRTLHDKIEDQRKQILNLEAARDRVVKNTQQQTVVAKAATKEGRVKRSLYDQQVGVNRLLKLKHHVASQRQGEIIRQLRDLVDKVVFQRICDDVYAIPDAEFTKDLPPTLANAGSESQGVES